MYYDCKHFDFTLESVSASVAISDAKETCKVQLCVPIPGF